MEIIIKTIRVFERHHRIPTRLCKHSMITNMCNTHIICNIIHLYMYLCMDFKTNLFKLSYITTLSILSGFINVSHRCAHDNNNYKFIILLQKYNLIISKERHSIHHIKPEYNSYCIGNGSCNSFLDKINFWRYLEIVVYYICVLYFGLYMVCICDINNNLSK